MTGIQIQAQYSTGASRQAIEQALVAAGKDPGHLRPADLALPEDFHTMGRIATTQLADLVQITPGDKVLDAGSGIGGTARYVAGGHNGGSARGYHVVASRFRNSRQGVPERTGARGGWAWEDVAAAVGEAHMHIVMTEYQVHYNTARLHQGISQRDPNDEPDAPHATMTDVDSGLRAPERRPLG